MEITDEIKKLGADIDASVKKLVSESSKASDEKTVKLFEEIEKKRAILEKMLEEQQKHLDTLETDIKKFKAEGGEPKKVKSIDEQLEGLFKPEEFKNLKQGNVKGLNFVIKAAGNLLLGTNYTGQIGLTSWDPEITRPPRRDPFIRQLVTNRRINSMYVAYAELKNRDGGADTVAEGAKKPQTDFDIVEASKKVEKIAHFIKTSKEALDDITALRAEINQELIEGVNLKLDEQILKGNGISPNLTGILTYLSAPISVVGMPWALGVSTPNTFDVLLVAAATVVANGFRPNYAVMHPNDVAMMGLAKNTQGIYIIPPFATASGTVIAGLTIVANSGMTQGDFLVGDFSKDILAIREEVNISVGYENDDFTKNLVTILAELRAVNYIKSNNLGAFVKGTFATVITAITKP